MATRSRALYRGGGGIMGRYHIEATVVSGQVVIANATAASAGEVENPTTTAAADYMGITTEAVTYSTTQADFDGFPSYRASSEEGTVGLIVDPLQVVAFNISGGATSGTALATGTPANILVEESGDATGLTITEGAVGTVSMVGGLVMGRTGNNAGIVKRLTAHTNSTSTAVTVPFPRTIASADTFIRVPFSKSIDNVQLTSDFTEANGIIATGTGAPFGVVDVDFDIINDEAIVYAVALDAFLNPA